MTRLVCKRRPPSRYGHPPDEIAAIYNSIVVRTASCTTCRAKAFVSAGNPLSLPDRAGHHGLRKHDARVHVTTHRSGDVPRAAARSTQSLSAHCSTACPYCTMRSSASLCSSTVTDGNGAGRCAPWARPGLDLNVTMFVKLQNPFALGHVSVGTQPENRIQLGRETTRRRCGGRQSALQRQV